MITDETDPDLGPWHETRQHRPVDRHALGLALLATTVVAIAVVIAAATGHIPVLVAGPIVGAAAAAWHLYLARPVTVVHRYRRPITPHRPPHPAAERPTTEPSPSLDRRRAQPTRSPHTTTEAPTR